MHYTAGAGTALSLAGAGLVPGDGLLCTVARLLLDGAGALFGLYLVLALALSAYGWMLRRRAPGPRAAGLDRPRPTRLPGPAATWAVPVPRAAEPAGTDAVAGRRA